MENLEATRVKEPNLDPSVTGHFFLTLPLGGLNRQGKHHLWGARNEENVDERNKYAIRTAQETNWYPVLFSQDAHHCQSWPGIFKAEKRG